MNDELREAIEAERAAWPEFYNDRATAGELEAACAATDAAVAALRAKADAADRVRDYAKRCDAIGHDKAASVIKRVTNRTVATGIRRALDGDQP